VPLFTSGGPGLVHKNLVLFTSLVKIAKSQIKNNKAINSFIHSFL